MSTPSFHLLRMIRDMPLCGEYVWGAELRRPAALASSALSVIKLFVIHQTLVPAEWGITCLQKPHITQLNELSESEVSELTMSMFNETTFAILRRQGRRGITIVRWQLKLIYDI